MAFNFKKSAVIGKLQGNEKQAEELEKILRKHVFDEELVSGSCE